MSKTDIPPHYTENIAQHLKRVRTLLDKHGVPLLLAHRQAMQRKDRHAPAESLPYKKYLGELREELAALHSADIAYILEALPINQRLLVWDLVKSGREGKILIEVSDAVRASLIAVMSRDELREAAERLDTAEIAELAPDLPQAVVRDVFKSLSIDEREQLRAAMSYPANAVGTLMDFDMVTVRADVTLEAVLRYLRRFDELPNHIDQLFVIDRDGLFKGVLPLNLLLVNQPEAKVSALMVVDTIKLQPDEKAEQAAQAFERYNLVSAPVVDDEGKLLGRVTVNTVMDYIRSESEIDALNLAGVHEQEDIFASVWGSMKNRWLWLALTLCATFLASRVIGSFENTIVKYAALATLLPIIAGIAGNSGSQTTAIIIRSLALRQITSSSARRLIGKEFTIAGLNGLIWGGAAGIFAYLLYHDVRLGLVMAGAMELSLLLGTAAGMLISLAMQRMGRAPSIGSNAILTAITSSGGFFIFLGLATIFLIR